MARNSNKKIKSQKTAVKKPSPKPKRAAGIKKSTVRSKKSTLRKSPGGPKKSTLKKSTPVKSTAPSRKKIEKPKPLVVLEPVREEPVKVPEKEKKSNRFILKFGIGALALIFMIFVGSKILNNNRGVNIEKDKVSIDSKELNRKMAEKVADAVPTVVVLRSKVEKEKAEKAAPSVVKKQDEKAASKEKAYTGANVYTVNRGDTLAVISKKLYNDYALWKKIFDANRDMISNPDEIYPGQKIKIPK